jgi:PAS domain S-box-containing protein
MADYLPVILWVADPEGGIQFVNRTYSEFFGVTRSEVEGHQWRQLLHPDDAARYVEEFLFAVRARKSYTLEARVRRADREWRRVASHGEVRYSATGKYLGHLGISLDVTDQRRLEEQLRQSHKLETVGRLAGGIAHDFKNLLTVIVGATESLREAAGPESPAQAELIDEIQTAATRGADLTRQLLAFAHEQVIAPVDLDLNAVVRGSEKLLRRALGENVELVVATQPGLWTVRCDPGQLEQVILNLAINARDAMPRGGTLTIETANVRVDESHPARHAFLHLGPYVRLAIRDDGEGMSPEVKARAFEPFFTTKPKGKGTGLGLATAYGFVKQSQGHVLLESEVGRGTTFELYFPRVLARSSR